MDRLHQEVFSILRKHREVAGGPPVMSDEDVEQFDRERLLEILHENHIEVDYAIRLLCVDKTGVTQ